MGANDPTMLNAPERQVTIQKAVPEATPPSRRSGPSGAIKLQENMVSAGRALTQNVMRSLLTITGIVVGMIAIVTLVAILQGVKAEIKRQVEGLGANLVLVMPSKLDDTGQPNPAAMIGISDLTDADVTALRAVPGVAKVSPVYIVTGTVELPNGPSTSAFVVATNKDGVQMNPTTIGEGRYYRDDEGNVCILGWQPRQDLFGNGPCLGKTVRMAKRDWKVVGVLARPKNDGTLGSAVMALKTLVYLPSSTVQREIPGGQINRIALQTDYQHPADKMLAQMNAVMLKSHKGKEDFGVITQQKGLALVIKLVTLAQSLLVLIATISLFVAGIGIMNIMLVTVTERTREIGIRKTVGARRSDIFTQFLVEAVILSILGGVIGLGFSYVICIVIAKTSPLTPLITPGVAVLALAVCSVVGILFGVTPAVRAARLDPIEALRHE